MRTFWAAWLAVQSALLVGARPDRALSRVVNTKYGRVQGFIQQHASHSLPPVEVFLGIPYASPPSGEGRFTPTSSPLPWEDVRKCLETPPVCPQPPLDPDPSLVPPLRAAHLAAIKPLLENQSEDCLYLNIYSPHDGKWRGVGGGVLRWQDINQEPNKATQKTCFQGIMNFKKMSRLQEMIQQTA